MHDSYSKRFITGYRHNLGIIRGNLYCRVRAQLRLSRAAMARLIGMTHPALRYRERFKQMYHLNEIVGLYEVSGLDAKSFIELLREIA